jgi:branched-subunit amino acid aminotransferase/4-amino-4-deoxychorismate lyase
MKIWLDGRIVPADRATVSALDPAVQYGLGVFEVTRAYDGEPYLLDRHLARMRRSARSFGLRIGPTDTDIARGARSLLRALKMESANVRLVQTGGGKFMILATPLPALPAAWYRRGAAIDFTPWRRDPLAPLHGHKTLNYLENVLTRERARARGLADCLFLSMDGRVLEGCVTNVFLASKTHLATPTLKGILPGVTRNVVINLARSLGLVVDECLLRPRHFETAEEVFLTNALIEVLPVSRIGSHRIAAPGPMTKALASAYRLAITTS